MNRERGASQGYGCEASLAPERVKGLILHRDGTVGRDAQWALASKDKADYARYRGIMQQLPNDSRGGTWSRPRNNQ